MTGRGRLYLIRHAQTDGNGDHYVGWEDLELNATGLAQAAKVAEALAAVHLDAIYCSPLRRARQTAAPMVERRKASDGTTLIAQPRAELMEINYGEYQGRLKRDHPLHLRHNHVHQRMPAGESLADVFQRVSRIASELLVRLRLGETLAVVGHYRSNQFLRGVLAGESFDFALSRFDYKPANGSLLCLQLVGLAGTNRLEEVAFPIPGAYPQAEEPQ